jgi:RES domain
MTVAICHECIQDEYLSADLKVNGERIACVECGKRRKGITVEDLGKRLEPILRECYVPGEEYRKFSSEDDDRGHFVQKGEDFTDIVQEVMGTLHSCHDEILGAIMEADNYWPPDGESAYWDDSTCYVFNRFRSDPAAFPNWQGTLEELKHGRRFFSPSAKQLFDRLFANIDQLKCYASGKILPVSYQLPQGTRLFRARVANSQETLNQVCADPGRHVGPPPPAQARSGRMNPEGVSVLYASEDEKTCIAEMRPAIHSEVAIISLVTSRNLRILDFTRLDRAYQKHSLFDPDFTMKYETHRFLKRLHRLISQPIVPGKEVDYLITQTMAEYLAHVHPDPFDGILFESAQKVGGMNIVIFPDGDSVRSDANEKFGVEYEEGSLKIARIGRVEVTHSEMAYYTDDSGEVRVYEPYEEHE